MATASDVKSDAEDAVHSTQHAGLGSQLSALSSQLSALSDPAASMCGWKYRHWIEALQKAGGHFVTAADILDGKISLSACNLLLRHDIDQCELYANVWPLLAIEYRFGVRSTTYLFAENDSRNWSCRRKGFPSFRKQWKLKGVDQVLRYQEEGFEFGLHVDAVGRCCRRGNTVDSREAIGVLGHDLARLRSQGIRVRTMAAHGFAWPDGVRSWYDNYAAEFDYTAGDAAVQSQFHVLERFAEQGRPVSARLGLGRLKRMKSIWLPRHVPFGWLHADTVQTHLKADALTLTDAAGSWKYIGVRELASLIPQLPGCLVVLNVHPIYYAYGDDGLEFVPRSTQFDDHQWLADANVAGTRRVPSAAEPRHTACACYFGPDSAPPRYRGKLDFDRIGPEWVSDRLGGDELETLNGQLRSVNARFKGGPWFDRLINSPNAEIIAWLDEFIDPRGREQLRVIELCGGVGPVAVGLTRHGFRPANMAVTDFDPKHLRMAQELSQSVTGGKVRVFPLDLRNVACEEQFDIAVISSWENSILPYDQVTAQCRKLVAADGLLVMTFLEKSRIQSEGYDYFPDRLLQQKTYYAITADELAAIFDQNGFEPVCYLDHGYPKVRFPRHVLVGRRRPLSAPKGRDTIAQGNALGSGVSSSSGALKGRNRRLHGLYLALSGLPFLSRFLSPGRCPGLSYSAPSGLVNEGLFDALRAASQRYYDELHRVLSQHGELPPWPLMLNVGPLVRGKNIEDLPPADRVRLLSLCVRKATCHPFGPWNLDYSRTGFDGPAVLTGLLVGYGNKCGAVAELTRCLLELHGIPCRTIHCAGKLPNGEPVQHCLNEVLIDGKWRLLDNDVFQFCDSFMTAGDGSLMTREEVLSLGVDELIRRVPWPYTYRGFDYDAGWVERNWSAWYYAVAGSDRDLG